MKVYLLYPDRDFDFKNKYEDPYSEDLVRDLGLDILFEKMSKGDSFIYNVVRKVILSYEKDLRVILYRPDVLKDCIKNKEIVERIYNLVNTAIEARKKAWLSIFSTNVTSLLGSSVSLLKIFLGYLKELREIADNYKDRFDSEGFLKFFSTLQEELTDEFFAISNVQLSDLKFRNGVFIKAKLGPGLEGKDYKLLKSNKKVLLKKKFSNLALLKPPSYIFSLHPRDDAGINTLTSIRERSVYNVAQILANVGDHVLSFFDQLKSELAFYLGANNLYEELLSLNLPLSFPIPYESDRRIRKFSGLYDISLALTKRENIVGNDLNAEEKDLYVITGANRGGKTTFLRSIGQAQILMQSGLFVPAKSFSANINNKLFTHFYRKEDPQLESGKLDEELKRLSRIVNDIQINSLLLLNESFSSTNEQEGSEIAIEVIDALTENNIEVFYVTHLYEFAKYYFEKNQNNTMFLRAERKEDGKRTYRILEGEPLPTGFAKDLYKSIFGDSSYKDSRQVTKVE
ncbi:DNA mismatch repair protein MutS [Dictyoglomus thermophilum]|uniref:MutS-related protein n=1 Tax=Dictyoglomus thermophilum TaxID=14 RepID=UPI0011EAFB1E|nr:DNA mismatch repair protein MutS [Dictyoglomus thermophilum]TYT24058.1 DNA mismatch repair protein MutS [Dictyoglomus thermophilum]